MTVVKIQIELITEQNNNAQLESTVEYVIGGQPWKKHELVFVVDLICRKSKSTND